MHWRGFLALFGVSVGLAHGFLHPPHRYITANDTKEALSHIESPHLHYRLASSKLEYQCGPDYGSCPSGTCCSSAGRSSFPRELKSGSHRRFGTGFCGTTVAHCRSPDCMIDYGRCDAHKSPTGPPTKDVLRPHLGRVPYSPQEIRSCTVPGTIALTFDDGPGRYTGDLLDLLDRYDARATFFVTGINNGKGQIDDPNLPWAEMIERMVVDGHQVASHTWSHEDLSKVTSEQRADQLLKNEGAIRNIIGSFPTYMRPPYSSCLPDSGCGQDLDDLGYHIVLYDIDTEDYKNDSPELIELSKGIFDRALKSGNPEHTSWLVIGHDIHEQTVHNLTEHMLKTSIDLGYRPVTVGECLRDPRDNWYRADSRWAGNKTKKEHPYRGPKNSTTPQVSLDGTCGANSTCFGSRFGLCCGSNNVCGNTTSHCGYGCNKKAGYCSVGVPSNGDALASSSPEAKSVRSEADSSPRVMGSAAVTSFALALVVAMWM
ncbi:Chitin deacetylase [Penicillium oxalicum]|uniref:Chitin deacetylase n=1 Tax=Penicillium oxalicum TaxID=69781 RepID=UPI0020B74796|nr:Chitin deacetylase [Penicillium oxalicum]KAI2789459.1 Chitin deacetylase [Penicillium oxalicum]